MGPVDKRSYDLQLLVRVEPLTDQYAEREGAALDFRPVRDSDVLKAAILMNFASDLPAIDIFERLHPVVRRSRSYLMTYGSGLWQTIGVRISEIGNGV